MKHHSLAAGERSHVTTRILSQPLALVFGITLVPSLIACGDGGYSGNSVSVAELRNQQEENENAIARIKEGKERMSAAHARAMRERLIELPEGTPTEFANALEAQAARYEERNALSKAPAYRCMDTLEAAYAEHSRCLETVIARCEPDEDGLCDNAQALSHCSNISSDIATMKRSCVIWQGRDFPRDAVDLCMEASMHCYASESGNSANTDDSLQRCDSIAFECEKHHSKDARTQERMATCKDTVLACAESMTNCAETTADFGYGPCGRRSEECRSEILACEETYAAHQETEEALEACTYDARSTCGLSDDANFSPEDASPEAESGDAVEQGTLTQSEEKAESGETFRPDASMNACADAFNTCYDLRQQLIEEREAREAEERRTVAAPEGWSPHN